MTTVLAVREQTRARYPDEEGYVERDGIRVFWERYGEGEPTFLLPPTWEIVHSRFWKCQIPYLSRLGRVVTFDPRGNGRSDRPRDYEAYRRREFARDAVAVLDVAGVERAISVARSEVVVFGLVSAATLARMESSAARFFAEVITARTSGRCS